METVALGHPPCWSWIHPAQVSGEPFFHLPSCMSAPLHSSPTHTGYDRTFELCTWTIHCQYSYHPGQVINLSLSSNDQVQLLHSDFLTSCAHMVVLRRTTANLNILKVIDYIWDVMLRSFHIHVPAPSLTKQQMFIKVATVVLHFGLAPQTNRAPHGTFHRSQ
jgi:hypothetical protein